MLQVIKRVQQSALTVTAIVVLLLTSGTNLSHAQQWPSKAISIVVPFPPGGTTDVLARTIAQDLSASLGQPVVVENKPGAGATLGADFVAKSKPDGYVLLMGAVHHTVATSAYKKLPYDFQRDLSPISLVALVPNVLVVTTGLAAKNPLEVVALAKAQPSRLTFGSAGNGTVQHLIGAQFEAMGGVDLVHVPYKGSGPLVTDLIGGQISMSFDTITPVLPHIRSGKLRALAVTTIKRSPALPDIPTLDEAGLKGFNLGTWFGLLAPAGTPPAIVDRLSQEVAKIIAKPEFRKKMDDIGADPIANTPSQMAKLIKDDTERFVKLVKDAKLTVE